MACPLAPEAPLSFGRHRAGTTGLAGLAGLAGLVPKGSKVLITFKLPLIRPLFTKVKGSTF